MSCSRILCSLVVTLSFGCASVPGDLTVNPMDGGTDSRASLLDRANVDVAPFDTRAADTQTADTNLADTTRSDVAVVDSSNTDVRVNSDARVDTSVPQDSAVVPSAIGDALAVLGAANAQAVDALYYGISVGSGWPMKEESRWLFVTRWPNAPGPVFWTSALNEWNTSNRPASRVQGTDFYFVILNPSEFTGDARGAKYKWFSSGTFRAPPEARAYGEDENGEFGYASAPTGIRYLERMPDFRSAHLGPTRTVRISVPANFASQVTRRVLVMHDGQNLFTSTDVPWGGWHVNDALGGSFSDLLVVGIDNASDRFEAYAHVSDRLQSIGTHG